MNSEFKIHDLGLIDLLSERNRLVQQKTEKAWNDKNDIHISRSEWYIIAKIYNKQPSISSITKHVDISRQATHKVIKNIAAKGLAEVHKMKDNKKEKYIELTALGNECYETHAALKAELEKNIAENVGEESVKKLKDILRADWGL